MPLVVHAGALSARQGPRYFSGDGAADLSRRCRKCGSPSPGENVFGVRKDETYKRAILDHAREDPVLSRCLTYLGHYDDPRPVIAAADVVVCPSRFESLGMVHLETYGDGPPHRQHEQRRPCRNRAVMAKRAISFRPKIRTHWRLVCLTLLRDPALRARMGQAGRAHVLDHFTAAAYARIGLSAARQHTGRIVMDILLISRCPPFPLYYGDRLIPYHLARELSGAASPDRSAGVLPAAGRHRRRAALRALFPQRQADPRAAPHQPRLLAAQPQRRSAFSPIGGGKLVAGDVGTRFNGWCGSASYDVVHLFGGVQVYEYLPLVRRLPNVIVPYESVQPVVGTRR